ncbi:MAG: MFS transporter [Candidatus Omnitrophica bacterium]|nr:MFS transporter [Candidatus Omnitrophota bacterium]
MRSLLSHRNFRLLWLGQICSQSGDRLTQILLVALVAGRSSGSTLGLAKVLVVTSLPALLLNPIAGVFVDRWDRKWTMIFCDLIRAGAILSLPWLIRFPSEVTFYLGVFVLFAVGSFFMPARLAMIPDLAPADRLAQANALFTASGMIGSTLILIVGAFLVEWIGPLKSSWVNAANYMASALFILPILLKKESRRRARKESPQKIFSEIAEGIQQLWRHEGTRRVAALLGFLMAGAGASVVVATVLTQQALGSVTKDLGFLSFWLGIGMLAGSTAYGRWGTRIRRRTVLAAAFCLCGAALWIFVEAVLGLKSRVGASIAAAFLGIGIAPVGIVANTLVHEAHPERLHGRIFSSLGVVINLAWIGSMLSAGWLADRWNRGFLLCAIGAAFVLGGMILLCYTKKQR